MSRSSVYHVPAASKKPLLTSVILVAANAGAMATHLLSRLIRSIGYLFRTFVLLPLGLMLFAFLLLSWNDKTQAPDVQAMVAIMEGVQNGTAGTAPGMILNWGCASSPGCIPQPITIEDQAHDLASLLRAIYAALVSLILVVKLMSRVVLSLKFFVWRPVNLLASSASCAFRPAVKSLAKTECRVPHG